jgi:hypothetical protein
VFKLLRLALITNCLMGRSARTAKPKHRIVGSWEAIDPDLVCLANEQCFFQRAVVPICCWYERSSLAIQR